VKLAAQPRVQRTRLRRAPTEAVSSQKTFANNASGKTRRAADALVRQHVPKAEEMHSNSAVIETTTGDKAIINELLGGLSLAPYGIFLLLSAYAFSVGWLNWKTNGGPPYLGGVLAWLIDRLIRWYYRKKYNFTFEIPQSRSNQESQSNIKGIVVIVAVIGLFVTWYLDENLHSQIRFIPLWFGFCVLLRGMDWLQKRWTGFGLFHILFGIIPIGMSVAPLILGISSDNQYFGLEGIYELSAMGVVIVAISIMEHLIFLNVRVSDFD